MKTKLRAGLTAVLIAGLLLSSCGQTTMQSQTLTPLDSSLINTTPDTDTMIGSSYAPSEVYSLPRIGFFKFIDVPGMVLYTDQSNGAMLAYINKITGNSYYFCFDPLCTHYSCTAEALHLTHYMVYCNGKLYAVRPEAERGGGGTTLYSVELDATELKKCYQSDGNEIFDLLVYKDTILFGQGKTEGGKNILAYDTTTEKTRILGEQLDLQIDCYFAANNAVYYTFVGDTHLYKTEDLFETSEKLFDIAKITGKQYGDATHIYGVEYLPDENGEKGERAIVRCSLETGKEETLYISTDCRIRFVGMDDTYCYFYPILQVETPFKRSGGTPIVNPAGGVLYRIPKEGGKTEIILNDIHYCVEYMAEIQDGELYVTGHKYSQRGEYGSSKTFAGILIDGEIKEITPR